MPWKLGEELKEARLMPMNVLGGRLRNITVGVGAMAGLVDFILVEVVAEYDSSTTGSIYE